MIPLIAGGAADPYRITEWVQGTSNLVAGYRNADGRTLVSAALGAGEATAVFLIAGQSNSCNHDDTLYTPTSSKVHNLSVYDGAVYQAKDPLLGGEGTGGCWAGRLGDKLIAAGTYARVILVPVGVGGTTVAQWAAGGPLNHRLTVALARLAARGLAVTAALWHQGEQDADSVTTQAAYQASLLSVIQTTRDAGMAAPWLIAQATHPYTTSSTAVRAAQAAVVDNVTIFAGPDTDTLTGTDRQADDTHFTAAGSDAAAALWKTAILAAL